MCKVTATEQPTAAQPGSGPPFAFLLLLLVQPTLLDSPQPLVQATLLPLAQVTEAASCRVRVTTLKASSSGADGHKVKLTALVVLAGGTRELLSQPGRLEAVTHSAAAQQGGR